MGKRFTYKCLLFDRLVPVKISLNWRSKPNRYKYWFYDLAHNGSLSPEKCSPKVVKLRVYKLQISKETIMFSSRIPKGEIFTDNYKSIVTKLVMMAQWHRSDLTNIVQGLSAPLHHKTPWRNFNDFHNFRVYASLFSVNSLENISSILASTPNIIT